MNFRKNVEKFEIEANVKLYKVGEHLLESIIGLPILNPSRVMSPIIYLYASVSARNIEAISTIKEKMIDDRFEKAFDFRNSKDTVPVANSTQVTIYLKNVFTQWSNIAAQNNIKIDDYLIAENNSILNDFSLIGQPIDDFQRFIDQYKLIEPYYIKNKEDSELAPFYKAELHNLYNQYSSVFSSDTIELFRELVEHSKIQAIFERMEKVIESIKEIILSEAPMAIATLADKFVASQNMQSEVANFLSAKEFEENILMQIKLTPSQTISEMIHFKDNSSVVKHRNGAYEVLPFNDIGLATQGLIDSAIEYKLRKKPKLAEFFRKRFSELCVDFVDVDIVIDTYLEHEQILKNMKFDFNLFKDKSFEVLDDAMHAKVHEYKIDRYAHVILSNKYKNLLTDKSLAIFKELYEGNIEEKTIQNLVGKKLAAIKTPEDFEYYLRKVANQFNDFNPDALMIKLEEFGIEPLLTENNIYVFEVTSFEQSTELGSNSWCISRSSSYFDNYTSNEARQFFIYDFNEPETSNESMIGITINKDGTFSTQHLKNDDYIRPNEFLSEIKKNLILKELEDYELDNELMEKYGLTDQCINEAKTKKIIKVTI